MVDTSRLQGKTALVTGAGNGIGAAISKRLADEGANVVVADIDIDAARKVAETLNQGSGIKSVAVKVDVSDEDAVEACVASAVKFGSGKLDILVNNAARYVFAPVTDATNSEWDTVLGTNVKGYAFMIKHAAKHMKANGGNAQKSGGSIVNVASISSVIAQPGFVPYSASKGAILQITRVSALDLGPHGIRVNAVCPGPILTEGTRKHAESLGKTVDEIVSDMNSHMIIQRMGDVSEVAAAVAFLSSPDASFITGASLMVDGGYTCV